VPSPSISALFAAGQSIWLDLIRRDLLTGGDLARMVADGRITGLTSNPTIFEKAIAGSRDYDAQLTQLARAGKNAHEIFDALAIQDIQGACDVFRPVFERTRGADGFASIEVSPLLARSTDETLAEARRLKKAVDRPNVMVKIPATQEGVPAIRAAIAEGISINITLIFSVDVYEQVVEAYLAGLETRVARGQDIQDIASVASFFVSRVDTLVDPMLEARAKEGNAATGGAARALVGKIAVANARAAYARFVELFQGPRWEALAAKGARVQRPLWASTGTKNKAYSDVKYVEELVGKDTVNTMPPDTLTAFADHGMVAESLLAHKDTARADLKALAGTGVSLAAACAQLERDGVRTFADSFHELIARIEARRAALVLTAPERFRAAPGALAAAVDARLAALAETKAATRLFARDVTLWSTDAAVGRTIADRLGWLVAPVTMSDEIAPLVAWAADIAHAGFTDAVVLGMGGSSLCPDLFARTFPPTNGALKLHVLDSTAPGAIARLTASLDVAKTLFLVSTKSGNTTETLSFARYFEEEVEARTGRPPGDHFVAITDPGSPLEALALQRGYRHTFLNAPDVGGRYSALTYFGLVPAALLGMDLAALLSSANAMLAASGPRAGASENPGLWLGAFLGEAARAGRDKVTLVVPGRLAALGAWLEQLIAESTGKEGKGLVPVADEPLGAPAAYGTDRVFVAVGLAGEDAAGTHAALDALAAAGHPVARLTLDRAEDVGAEFVRWEIATAIVSSILGVNAFDEPNVKESKDNTAKGLAVFAARGALAPSHALARRNGLSFYAAGTFGSDLKPAIETAAHGGDGFAAALTGAFERARAGDYVAILAYIDATPAEAAALAMLRLLVRDRLRTATTYGPGPRYLHSTGQLHKGGPLSGIYLVITAETTSDVSIPDAPYSFGVLIDAQAAGDFESLTAHQRRAVRVHLEGDRTAALLALLDVAGDALHLAQAAS
jgi:transaldolase/glucose-6-phosphate isomerase